MLRIEGLKNKCMKPLRGKKEQLECKRFCLEKHEITSSTWTVAPQFICVVIGSSCTPRTLRRVDPGTATVAPALINERENAAEIASGPSSAFS